MVTNLSSSKLKVIFLYFFIKFKYAYRLQETLYHRLTLFCYRNITVLNFYLK